MSIDNSCALARPADKPSGYTLTELVIVLGILAVVLGSERNMAFLAIAALSSEWGGPTNTRGPLISESPSR